MTSHADSDPGKPSQAGDMGEAALRAADLLASQDTPKPGPPERQDPEKLARQIADDFRHTVNLSQQEDDPHDMLMELLVGEYHGRIPLAEIQGAWAGIKRHAIDTPLPVHHAVITEAERKRFMDERLASFGKIINMTYTNPETYASPEYAERVTNQLVLRMAIRDRKYMFSGRPGDRKDPHSSIIRESVLLGKTHGSASLMAAMDRLRAGFHRARTDMDGAGGVLRTVAREWEAKPQHGGQTFWNDPPEVAVE